MTNSNQKIKLPNRAWKTLKILLSQLPWAKTPKDILIAGKMEEIDKIKLTEEPTKEDKVWDDTEVELELYPKEIEVCKKALNFSIINGNVAATKYAAKLITVFIGDD